MFESYSKHPLNTRDRKGLLASTFAAFALYGLGAVALVWLAHRAVEVVEKPVSVLFAPTAVSQPEAQKPAPPPPSKPSRPKRAAAPVQPPPEVPPPPAPEPVTPKEMPLAAAPEANPNIVPASASGDEGVGLVDPNAKAGTGGSAGTLGGVGDGPINLPAGGIAPKPNRNNRIPEMPRAARAQGLEGMVELRIVVTKDGRVSQVEVLRGQEPFVTAAVEAVRSWRYDSPAQFNGKPVAVYRIVKIPFRLAGFGR